MPNTLKNITTHVHTLAVEIGERNVFHPRALASAARYTHSQAYPPLLKWFYPDRGNFIAFVSNFRSRKVMHQAVHHFRQCTDFPLQHIATVPWLPGVCWSDHLAFWHHGYRAFMLTDTAFYRYPFYHSADDTADKIHYPPFARLTENLFCTLVSMVNSSSAQY
ncbi:MAG: hypothetical protein L3J98_14215 [Gammaproteobacteria bacterium]|nr:hypothetical protein [Gammaproteobacteria bacterium]MCF6261292.1 hypothetical protein [Gammaproteobacteria bacterium]